MTEVTEYTKTAASPETKAAAKPEADTTLTKVNAAIDVWFSDLRGNLQGLDTETHNKIHAAKEVLKDRIAAIL